MGLLDPSHSLCFPFFFESHSLVILLCSVYCPFCFFFPCVLPNNIGAWLHEHVSEAKGLPCSDLRSTFPKKRGKIQMNSTCWDGSWIQLDSQKWTWHAWLHTGSGDHWPARLLGSASGPPYAHTLPSCISMLFFLTLYWPNRWPGMVHTHDSTDHLARYLDRSCHASVWAETSTQVRRHDSLTGCAGLA